MTINWFNPAWSIPSIVLWNKSFMQIAPSEGTNTSIFLTVGMISFTSCLKVCICTQMFTHHKAQWENSFCIRRATTKMNEIQSWHFWHSVQDSILSWHFYPIKTCHHCSSKTDSKNDPLWENGLNMWSPYLDIPCISEAFEMLDFLS